MLRLIACAIALPMMVHAHVAIAMSRTEAIRQAKAAVVSSGTDLSGLNAPVVAKHTDGKGKIWEITWSMKSDVPRELHVLVNETKHKVLVCPLGYFLYGWHPGEFTIAPPEEVRPFIAQDRYAIEVESNDLNGDGLCDYILVTEDGDGDSRKAEILLRQPDGQLGSVTANDRMISCLTCGGTQADAFDGITAGFKIFTVYSSSGDAASHFSCSATFAYAGEQSNWELTSETRDHSIMLRRGRSQTMLFSDFEGCY